MSVGLPQRAWSITSSWEIHWNFISHEKKIANSTQFVEGSWTQIWSRHNLLIHWQNSSLSPQALALASHLTITLKGYSKDNFDSKLIDRALGTAPWLSLGPEAGKASTNSVYFPVWCSCWQWQACFREKCFHSFKTDLVWESKRFQYWVCWRCRNWGKQVNYFNPHPPGCQSWRVADCPCNVLYAPGTSFAVV